MINLLSGSFFSCFIFFKQVRLNLGSIFTLSFMFIEALCSKYLLSYMSFLYRYFNKKFDIIFSSLFMLSQFMLLRDGRKLDAFISRLLWSLNSDDDCLSLCVGLGIEGKKIFFYGLVIDVMIGNKIIYRKRKNDGSTQK